MYWDTESLSSLTHEWATGQQVDLPTPVVLAEFIAVGGGESKGAPGTTTGSDTTADVYDTGITVMGAGSSFARGANRFFRASWGQGDVSLLFLVRQQPDPGGTV